VAWYRIREPKVGADETSVYAAVLMPRIRPPMHAAGEPPVLTSDALRPPRVAVGGDEPPRLIRVTTWIDRCTYEALVSDARQEGGAFHRSAFAELCCCWGLPSRLIRAGTTTRTKPVLLIFRR
jgi:hypothetical protein